MYKLTNFRMFNYAVPAIFVDWLTGCEKKTEIFVDPPMPPVTRLEKTLHILVSYVKEVGDPRVKPVQKSME